MQSITVFVKGVWCDVSLIPPNRRMIWNIESKSL